MNERFIILLEKYLEHSMTETESQEFESLVNSSTELKKEFEEQKRIKEVLRKMTLINPSKEKWDGYWLGIYNKIERGIAWIAISIGAIIFFGYVSIEAVNSFISDTETPLLVKTGVSILFFGTMVLIFSLLREKLFISKHDRYKEVQR